MFESKEHEELLAASAEVMSIQELIKRRRLV
jgi:hypothetical protein